MDDDEGVSNKWLVGSTGLKDIVIMGIGRQVSYADALNLAAWIVMIADDSDDHVAFRDLLRRVEHG